MRIRTVIVKTIVDRHSHVLCMFFFFSVGEVKELEDRLMAAELGQCRFACYNWQKG